MTKRELIELLNDLPDDLPVYLEVNSRLLVIEGIGVCERENEAIEYVYVIGTMPE